MSKKNHVIEKNPLVNVILILIPLFVIILVLVFLFLNNQIREQHNDILVLEEQLMALQEERDFYKQAYQITLADIRQLSTQFGGEERYDEIARALREQELQPSIRELELQEYSLTNPAIWVSYYEQDIIRTTCLNTVDINAITDDVLFVLEFEGEGDVSIYIDANRVARYSLVDDTIISFTIDLARGQHALDLVTTTGIELSALTIETQEIALENIIANKGEQWSVFNCEDYEQSSILEGPGALRILLNI